MKIHGGLCAAAVVTLVMLTAGCNGTDTARAVDRSTAPTSPAASSSQSPVADTSSTAPSASPSAAMTVSASTTCEVLFNINPSPMGQAIKLVKKRSMDDADLAMAKDLTDTFQHASATAQPSLKPYIDAMTASTQAIVDMFAAGASGRSRDLQDFRVAGLELVNRCTPFIR